MIRYALKCRDGHEFDSWFQSAGAYDTLVKAGHLRCAVCGGTQVDKTLMAPRVASAPDRTQNGLSRIEDARPEQVSAVAQMRRAVEENATYVGRNFASKAREMHEGGAPDAAIYGEASAAEARALLEEGVPVLPLPFRPRQKLQ